MSQKLMTLPEVRQILHTEPGAKFKRLTWDGCKVIRKPVESDKDIINYDLDKPGVIIEDCPAKQCDCKVGIWPFTPEDEKAQDYIQL